LPIAIFIEVSYNKILSHPKYAALIGPQEGERAAAKAWRPVAGRTSCTWGGAQEITRPAAVSNRSVGQSLEGGAFHADKKVRPYRPRLFVAPRCRQAGGTRRREVRRILRQHAAATLHASRHGRALLPPGKRPLSRALSRAARRLTGRGLSARLKAARIHSVRLPVH
jgi:hypothetical protein